MDQRRTHVLLMPCVHFFQQPSIVSFFTTKQKVKEKASDNSCVLITGLHSFGSLIFQSDFIYRLMCVHFFKSIHCMNILLFPNIQMMRHNSSEIGAVHILVQGTHIPSSSMFSFKVFFMWVKFALCSDFLHPLYQPPLRWHRLSWS